MSANANINCIRVLVVDDHELFRRGLRQLLEDEGFEVVDAVDADAALRRLRGFAADAVVVGVNLPAGSGAEAARSIRMAAPAPPVLVLATVADDERVLQAVRAGAAGYLLKEAELTEIVAGIKAVAAGQSALCPQAGRALIDHVRGSVEPEAATVVQDPHELSERELQVLSLVASGCGNAQIGQMLFVSPSTVKNHVSRLLEKLEVDNRVQAASYAIRNGLVDRNVTSN